MGNQPKEPHLLLFPNFSVCPVTTPLTWAVGSLRQYSIVSILVLDQYIPECLLWAGKQEAGVVPGHTRICLVSICLFSILIPLTLKWEHRPLVVPKSPSCGYVGFFWNLPKLLMCSRSIKDPWRAPCVLLSALSFKLFRKFPALQAWGEHTQQFPESPA